MRSWGLLNLQIPEVQALIVVIICHHDLFFLAGKRSGAARPQLCSLVALKPANVIIEGKRGAAAVGSANIERSWCFLYIYLASAHFSKMTFGRGAIFSQNYFELKATCLVKDVLLGPEPYLASTKVGIFLSLLIVV